MQALQALLILQMFPHTLLQEMREAIEVLSGGGAEDVRELVVAQVLILLALLAQKCRC
jgi:hypothetical protein